MYMWAREWGIQPSEFWAMTITEWWLEYDTRVDQRYRYAGNLTKNDVDAIMDFLAEGEERDEQNDRGHS